MAKVRRTVDDRLIILCPACKCGHAFDGRWKFNGNMDAPTFRDSMRVQNDTVHCHFYVTDGNIEFLADCAHELAGKTVPLEDW